MTVRRLQANSSADVEAYRTIRLRSLQADPDAFASTYEEAMQLDDAAWTARLSGFKGRPGAMFVDEIDGSITGTVGIGFTEWDPQPMLIAMWVDPAARGQGVGRRLVEAAVAWAGDQGATAVVLWVVKTNETAKALYRRCGFEPSGAVDTLPNNPCVDELEMRLSLGQVESESALK